VRISVLGQESTFRQSAEIGDANHIPEDMLDCVHKFRRIRLLIPNDLHTFEKPRVSFGYRDIMYATENQGTRDPASYPLY
jgi:hypothetical protein